MCDVMYDSEGLCHEPMVYVLIGAKTYLSLRSAPSVVLPNNKTKDRSETSVKKYSPITVTWKILPNKVSFVQFALYRIRLIHVLGSYIYCHNNIPLDEVEAFTP